MINSQTQFHCIQFFPHVLLWSILKWMLSSWFLVDWRRLLHWEGLKVGYVGDKQQRVHIVISKTDKVCRNGQTTQMHIMHTHKHSHWLWYWYSSFALRALCWLTIVCVKSETGLPFIGKCTIEPTRDAKDMTWKGNYKTTWHVRGVLKQHDM